MEATGTNGDTGKLPKLIVFDLDNTWWTPELYQLRKLQRSNQTPKANKDVKLFQGAEVFLSDHWPQLQAQGVQLAVASRTKSVSWAHSLLGQFGLKDQVFNFVEIFPGNKVRHFENLRDTTGIDFEDMLFLDDARDGKYGNCVPVSDLGVLCVHCPNGLQTVDIITNALDHYTKWNRSPSCIVESDGSLTIDHRRDPMLGQPQVGTVKLINEAKRFGFIQYRQGRSRDLFFHFRHLSPETADNIREGDSVSFVNVEDGTKSGEKQYRADSVVIESAVNQTEVEMKCFTMNQPFAALLANGYKDLETRNGTMFTQHPPGTRFLLHVGRRTYPDEGKHLDVMKSGGLNDEEIATLKKMPQGFGKGSVVAVLEIGETYETTVAERSDPDFQRRVAAYGKDSGRFVTEIRKVEYLKKPIQMPGQPGIFKVRIDPSAIPEGWEIGQKKTEDGESKERAFASISG